MTRLGSVLTDTVVAIAEKSSTMEERLSGPFKPLESAEAGRIAQAGISVWRSKAAKGDEQLFARRLALAGWTEEDALRSLKPAKLNEGAGLPAWTAALERMLGSIASFRLSALKEMPPFADAGQPVPFEELLAPFVHVAWEMLAEAEGEHLSWLHGQARIDLQRSLLKRLSKLSWQALELEYSAYCALDQFDIARMFVNRLQSYAGDAGEPSKDLYLRFVESMYDGKYIDFLNEYSVLARLLAQAVQDFAASCGEFLRRFIQDREAIGSTILNGAAAGRIAALKLDLSDPHEGGRTVYIVELEGGHKVVYKPKPLKISEAWHHLLEWLNARTDVPLDLKGVRVLDRGLYGWEAFVEPSPCADRAAVQRYYCRAGALLCLIYALDGTDIHNENMIACGEYPVIIDMETLLHPRLTLPYADERDDSALALAFERVNRSVLGTLFLPAWNHTPDGSYDVGGLFVDEELGKIRAKRISAVNSDGLSVREQEIAVETNDNAPTLDGRKVEITDFLPDFYSGFQHMYEILLRHQSELSDPGGPLAGFNGVPVRLVLRATNLYGRMLRQGLSPKLLRSGTDFALHFELFSRAALITEERNRLWPLIRKEQQDALSMDIPRFTMFSDQKGVAMENGARSEDLCEAAGFDIMMEKIRGLSREDCQFQLSLIRGALHARLAGIAHTAAKAPAPRRAAGSRAATTIGGAETELEIAEAIADRLKAEMIEAADGTRTWIAPRLHHDRFQYTPMDYDLYSGLSGIALFFAALARISGDPQYRQDALAALKAMRQDIRRDGRRVLDRLGIGGIAGLSSVIYALVTIHQLIEAPDLLEDAREMAALITDEAIARDRRFDVMQGAAGTIFALIALYDAAPAEAVLQQAAACGRHLLQSRAAAANGLRVWKSDMFAEPLCGFSHGAAGIAAALLRLHARTGDPALLEAAEEALAFERSCFRPEIGRWPDLRFTDADTGEGLTDAWCHGAAGIGLARLEALRHAAASQRDNARSQSHQEELETAVSIVRHTEWSGATDTVCCGNMGRLDFLIAVSMEHAGPGAASSVFAGLPQAVRQYAAETIATYRNQRSFHFTANIGFQPPGFFQGLSGIGYQLLRSRHPEQLPSVLLFDSPGN